MRIHLTALLTLFIFFALAQDYEVRISNITDEHGVDVPSTFGIAEDSMGFIWFGTVGGLYRYDGYRMKIFRNAEGQLNSLSSNTIRALLYDSVYNQLYIGTQFGGLNIYNLNTQTFTCYMPDDNVTGAISNSSIWSLMLDKDGLLWVGMENNQFNTFNPKTGLFKSIILQNQNPNLLKGSCTIRSVFQDREANIWVGTDNHGLYKIDKFGTQTHFYEEYENKNSLKNNFVISVCNDANHNLWIATFGASVAKYNHEQKKFDHVLNRRESSLGPISGLTYTIIPDDDNNLWIGTEYGLSVMDIGTLKAKHYVHQFSSNDGLTDNRIRKLFRDSKGVMWIGTEAGVDKLVQQYNFRSYIHKTDEKNTLPGGIVRAIYKDSDSTLWFGLIDKGLVRYNQRSNKYTHFIDNTTLNGDIICYQISAFLEDSKGNFWIGDWEKGILKFDRKKNKYTNVLSSHFGTPKLVDNRIQTIVEDSTGDLWIGTESGVVWFDYTNMDIEYIMHDEKNFNSLSGNAVQSQALELDENGNLWVGTWANGLNYIEIKRKRPLQYKVHRFLKSDENQFLSNNNVISLFKQNDSILWIGTFGGGLNKFNTHTKKAKLYEISDGLPNNIIFSIKPGENHDIWLSTDYGISKLNTKTDEFTNFDASDGLQDVHFFWGAAFKSNDGEVFFGGINGLNSFYPAQVTHKNHRSNIVITDIKIANEPLLSSIPVENISSLNLSYNQNYLSFDFSILDYSVSEKRKFIAKLEGLDTDWKDLGSQRSLNYPNLKPGQYTLKVAVLGRQSHKIENVKSLDLYIDNAWYLKWWSFLIYVGLFIALLYGIYSIRLKVLLTQKKQLSQKVKERTQEIVAKSNLLVQQNKEIHNQKEELAEKNKQLSEALTKLSELKEKAIESEKMASLGVLASGVAHEINNPLNYIQGGLFGIEQHFKNSDCGHAKHNKTFLNAIKEGVSRVAAIVSGLDQFSRGGESLDETCNLKEIINNCIVILSSQIKNRVAINNNLKPEVNYVVEGNQGKLHQAFLNVITNAEQAIKDKGAITIDAEHIQNKLKISITDNGNGISKNILNRITEPFFTTKDPGKGTGLGLSLTYRIIQEHKGQLLFNSEVGKGTTVDIILPIKKV